LPYNQVKNLGKEDTTEHYITGDDETAKVKNTRVKGEKGVKKRLEREKKKQKFATEGGGKGEQG